MNILEKTDKYRNPNSPSWGVWIFGTSVYHVISVDYPIMKICGTSIPISFSLHISNGYREHLLPLCLTLKLDILEAFFTHLKENRNCVYDRFFFTKDQPYLKYKAISLSSSYIYIEKDEFLFKGLNRFIELRKANIYEKENLFN